MKKGILTLIGGAEDKRHEKIILKTIVKKAKAKSIIIIPTASSYPRDVYHAYYDAFKDLGVAHIHNFDIRYSDEADKDDYFNKLQNADLVFFSGGDQTKLVPAIINTKLYAEIISRFNKGTIHIAGTSAGAAAASTPMLYDGDYHGFQKGSVNSAEGFGLLPKITVDTHFLQRERISRLTQFLIAQKDRKGIGLDENTAIMIYPNLQFEVIGSGMVTLLDTTRSINSNYNNINTNQVINVNNLKIGFISAGAKFSIRRWMILKSITQKL